MDVGTEYELLWQMNQKEKQTNEILLLPKNFYDDVKVFIKSLEKKDATEDETNTRRNALRLLNELHEKRKQKVIIYVAYKRSLPQPTIAEEELLYTKLMAIANTEKPQETNQGSTEGTLKLLQAIPEIILPSGKKVGPFEKGQMIEIDGNSDTEFLISNMICQKM